MTATNDPLARFALDRSAARNLDDGWAALCTLGTVNAQGDAEQRTLVLREHQSRLALFFSAHAPKWQELQARPTCSLQVYMPSIQVQYRIRAGWEIIAPKEVHESWLLRPDVPKKLDWIYERHAQSSPIDRNELLLELGEGQEVPDRAPASAMGVCLDPVRLERLQLTGHVHERECWEKDAQQQWQHQHLMP